MAKRTTEIADEFLSEGMKLALDAAGIALNKAAMGNGPLQSYDLLMARTLYMMTDGLKHLSQGLRETYNKLEEIERAAKR